jgi:GTP-binding protein LepA
VGYIITGIKTVQDLRVGDTLTRVDRKAQEPLSGYREAKPMVFCGLFPIDGDDYPMLRESLEKLQLNDASLNFEPETSRALGFGFRCGFLGLLHMDIIRERLEREYDLDLLATMPTVEYEALLTDGKQTIVRSPADMPDPGHIESIYEPFVRATILVPNDYVGAVMELCQDRRGEFEDMQYITSERVQLHYQLPLAEIVLEFFDLLKSRTRGYASLDYEMSGMRESDLVKLDILIAAETMDALSLISHRDKAYERGKSLVEKLKKEIPRQLFEVAIQAAIGKKIIARETVSAKRKDVIAKCYGGDISRKRKLLERQKEGKKRMKQVGNIEIPQKAFLAVLDIEKK